MRIWFPTVLTTLCVSFNAISQTPAAPAPASAATPTPPGAAGQSGNPATAVPPGLQNRNQVNPVLSQPRTGVPQGSQAAGATPGTQAGAPVQNQAFTPADQTVLNAIQQAVQRRFTGAGAPSGVGYQVVNGVVTLVGSVDTAAQREQLESTVRQIPGVTGVLDQLTVGQFPATQRTATGQPMRQGTLPGVNSLPQMNPQDQALLLRVRNSVLPQIQVAGQPAPVNFKVQEGVVTLTGTSRSVAQRDQIAFFVQQVPGVMQVNNQLVVNPNVSGAVNQNVPNNLTPTGRANTTTPPPVLENQSGVPSAVPAQTNPTSR